MNGFLNNLLDNLDMLRNAKKTLFLLFFMMSCDSSRKEESQIQDFLYKQIGKDEYYKIHNMMLDSLKNWEKAKLKTYLALRLYSHELNTLVCFNKLKNKLITSILFKCDVPNCVQENIWYFYGVNIKGKWYFFSGPTIVLPRPSNSLDVVPSFKKLHEIAMKQIYGGYLKPKGFLGLGGYEINEDFFQDLTSVAWYPGAKPQTQDEWDKIYLKIVEENWAKKDTTVYKSDQ
jgi:hypothetical protein